MGPIAGLSASRGIIVMRAWRVGVVVVRVAVAVVLAITIAAILLGGDGGVCDRLIAAHGESDG